MENIACLALTLAIACTGSTALAQAWPAKPLRWIVPFSAGGPADVVARVVGPKLAERLGQPVIIDNRVGATATSATKRLRVPPLTATRCSMSCPTS